MRNPGFQRSLYVIIGEINALELMLHDLKALDDGGEQHRVITAHVKSELHKKQRIKADLWP